MKIKFGKQIVVLLALILVFTACQPTSNEIPEDLAGKKEYLNQLQNQMGELKVKVKKVEDQIKELDPNATKDPIPVTTQTIAKQEFVKSIELQGNVEAKESAYISAETGGRIIYLNIEEGDYVRRGQIVGKIDNETLENSIAEVETALDLATETYERQKKLWDQEIGSEIQYLQAKNNKERLEKNLATLQTQLKKANITSPLSGFVEMKMQKAGEMAAPGNPIALIINTGSVKVVVDAPDKMIKSIKTGDKVSVTFPAFNKTFDAKVSKIGKTINPSNRTFEVEIAVDNKEGNLKPNLLAMVTITEEVIEDIVMVPMEVVQQNVSGDYFVYISKLGEDGQYASYTPVEIGISNGGNMIVTSGLEVGDVLIIDGGRIVSDNDLINPVTSNSEELSELQ